MKPIAALILAGWPLSVVAHPCPFDWNIEFLEPVKISGKNLEEFTKRFNEAVGKQTKGKIPKAIVYSVKPDSFTHVPSDSPFVKEMEMLIQRYSEVTAPLIKKGVSEYGGAAMDVDFPASFPVACILASPNVGAVNYEEAKEGLKITIHRELECRAYHVSAKFLEEAKEMQLGEQIPEEGDPVSLFFARFSEMNWAFHTDSEPAQDSVEVPILAGVTAYLPEKRVILVIETRAKHEEITKNMKERRYLENPSPGSSDKNKQPPDQPWGATGDKPAN